LIKTGQQLGNTGRGNPQASAFSNIQTSGMFDKGRDYL